jgi:hypothetical protein
MGSNHKSERTDAASASLYSYPRDSNPWAAYKKLQKKKKKLDHENMKKPSSKVAHNHGGQTALL